MVRRLEINICTSGVHRCHVYVYEWSECVNSPDTAYKRALTKLKWSHPKRSFGPYKSATMIHQEFKFRLPKAVYVFGVSVLAVITVLVWFVISSMMSDIRPQKTNLNGWLILAHTVGGSQRSTALAVPVSQCCRLMPLRFISQGCPVIVTSNFAGWLCLRSVQLAALHG